MNEHGVFEWHFKQELRRLNLKRFDVCETLGCTMPTLRNRIENPDSITIGEMKKMVETGFDKSIFLSL